MTSTGTTSTGTTRVDTDRTAVHQVLSALYAAWAAGDATAFAALYRDDATVVMPGVFHRGSAAVRQYMAAAFAGPLRGSRGIDEPRDVRIIGDTAIVVSTAGILMAGEEQLPTERERLATWVLCRQDGRWLIAAYTNTPAH
jgi:uncharacterized protein (TIGR02246 family)